MTCEDFQGGKLAVLAGRRVLALQRDHRPGIPFPGLWDLPGGGREGAESPEACVLRELREELALILTPERLVWRRRYPAVIAPGDWTWFFVALAAGAETEAIRLGDEGQRWSWMRIEAFVGSEQAVPHLRDRLSDFLQETGHGQ